MPGPTQAQAGPSSPGPARTRTTAVIEDGDEFLRTKILLLGLRRSGKTSIRQVLFDELPPKQSFFIEPTVQVTKHKYDSIIPLEIWDVPGDVTPETLGEPLSSFSTIIFVIDILGKFPQQVSRVVNFFVEAFQANTGIFLEVFVHKSEALSEEYRDETYEYLQRSILDELAEIPSKIVSVAQSPTSSNFPGSSQADFSTTSTTRAIEQDQIQPVFHLTSIHDNSIRSSFSEVLHRLLDATSLPHLEQLIDVFSIASQVKKAFLFDVKARVFVARDQSPPDSSNFGLCCDYLEMVNAFGGLYKSLNTSPSDHPRRNLGSVHNFMSPAPSVGPSTPSSPKSRASTPTHTISQPSTFLARPPLPGPAFTSPPSSNPSSSPPIFRAHSRRPSAGTSGNSESAVGDIITNTASSSPSTSVQTLTQVLAQSHPHSAPSSGAVVNVQPAAKANLKVQNSSDANRKKSVFHAFAATTLSEMTLLYIGITPPVDSNQSSNTTSPNRANLALVAMLLNRDWQDKRGLIEYNSVFLREGVQEIHDVELESRKRKSPKA